MATIESHILVTVCLQFPSIVRNNYGIKELFSSVEPGFACIHLHPDMTEAQTTAAWPVKIIKIFCLFSMDKSENATLALVLCNDNPAPSPWCKWSFVLNQQSVVATLGSVFLAGSQFFGAKNLLQSRHRLHQLVHLGRKGLWEGAIGHSCTLGWCWGIWWL